MIISVIGVGVGGVVEGGGGEEKGSSREGTGPE